MPYPLLPPATTKAADADARRWRLGLALCVARVFALFHFVGGWGIWIGMRPVRTAWAFLGIGLGASALALIAAFRKHLDFRIRAWLITAPATLASLFVFTLVGFLSGPAALLTLTLTLSGLLLGVRALLGLAAFSLVWLTASGIAVVEGWIPPPSPAGSSPLDPLVWARTIGMMTLAAGALGALIINLIEKLDASLRDAKEASEHREIAERARLDAERRALEAQQMESVGRLSAGVAHDFNNNLTTIVGCAELLAMKFASEGRSEPLLDDIFTAAQRSAELTQQLLLYSRKAQMVRKPVDLHRLIEESVRLFRRTSANGITVVMRLEAEQAVISGDATRLQSALLNLLVNARDAMQLGGTLTVSTAVHTVLEEEGAAPKHYVKVEVTDTGDGIASDALPKIFEPFFTTKPSGKGTGLGLAAVAGTVKAHGGTVEAVSELGEGTTLRFLLPRMEADEARVALPVSRPMTRGSGQILVVDDDMMVRSTAVLALRSFGYVVAEAGDGHTAIELIKNASRPFDLVLLDLRMPGLSGEATFDALMAFDPTLPVLIWSGYAGGQDVQGMLDRGAKGFLQKPYNVQDLGDAVARALRPRWPEPVEATTAPRP